MRHSVTLAALSGVVALSACAHAPDTMMGPPDFTPIAISPAPNARFYADCIGQAATNGTYGRAHDADSELVLFTCTGAPAKAFHDALAARSAEIGSERQIGGRTIRSTNPVQRDLFGVDWCSSDGRDYTCVVSLNAGDYLRP